MKQFKHVLITRYNWQNETNDFYGNNPILDTLGIDPKKWMKDRLELFKATRESVLSQGVDFDWIISFDGNTPVSYVKKVCTAPNMFPVYNDVRDLIFDYPEPYIITTRLDNEDIYLPGALKAIQDAFEPMLMVIDIDYKQWDMDTDKYYGSDRDNASGPFLSLVEPKDYVKTCYCRPHSVLASGYPSKDGQKIAIRPHKIMQPLALMVLHDHNIANKIVGREVR